MRNNFNSRFKSETLKIFFASVLGVSPVSAWSTEHSTTNWAQAIFGGISVSPGVGVISPTLRVKRDSDRYHGDITGSPGVFSLYFDVALRDFDIPGTPFGVSWFTQASTFATHKQFDDNPNDKEMKDVGTSVDGYYAYTIPVIFYRKEQEDKVMRAGGGIGYGVLRFSGDIVLTADGVLPPVPNKTPVRGEGKKLFTYALFCDLQWTNNWRVRVAVTSMLLNDPNYDYEFDEFALTVSKKVTLF